MGETSRRKRARSEFIALSLARAELQRGEVRVAGDHLEKVKEGLDRAAGIVRQVLAQSDPAKATRVPVDLNQVLRETEEFVQSRKEFAAIAFGLELAREPLLVSASPVMLGQVAVNLILNACEAQPRGGEVRVSSRREGTMSRPSVVSALPCTTRAKPPITT